MVDIGARGRDPFDFSQTKYPHLGGFVAVDRVGVVQVADPPARTGCPPQKCPLIRWFLVATGERVAGCMPNVCPIARGCARWRRSADRTGVPWIRAAEPCLRVGAGIAADRVRVCPKAATDGCNVGPLVMTAPHPRGAASGSCRGVTPVSPTRRSRARVWRAARSGPPER